MLHPSPNWQVVLSKQSSFSLKRVLSTEDLLYWFVCTL
nr:MAG TPA: hypothetical protein [Caudoviricetes sp.]